jgi:hemolysin III
VQPEKPLYRGVSHTWAFFGALVATAPLVLAARSGVAARAAVVFGASLALLFGVSTLYHRIEWSPIARQRMRRLDHAAIFVLIAGGYTPLFSVFPLRGSYSALWIIWLGAGLGVAKSIAWPGSPKWVTALLCVALGWAVAGQVIASASMVGWLATGMLVASGSTYSIGAIVYALKKPNPLPRVFGYHEVFHAIVILASVCLYVHVLLVIRAAVS